METGRQGLQQQLRWANRSRSAACNPTPPPPLEPSSPEASELPEREGSPDSNVGQEALEQDLLLLEDVAWDVQPLPWTAEMETQTDTAKSKGPLQLMLSATDGVRGSTQVTHIPQADKRPRGYAGDDRVSGQELWCGATLSGTEGCANVTELSAVAVANLMYGRVGPS
ncbi:hypothetical protein HPB47_001713 [Ixodes persulcatus]|uniref:Uncharacterized protein n=1 Tax=Ixodes persulcatus TaxID=34615 RepID=A0AC60PN90_IXOPE|nr:hypothetical protein HPB47_001713 [Ixodes persulcatus]